MPDLLLLEPIGGVAGDMFLAAALDLGVSRAELDRALGALGLDGWSLQVTRTEVNGIAGTHLDVQVEGRQPGHRHLSEILALVAGSGLPARVRQAATALFECIGRAEAKVHGIPLESVHFHEVGAVDSILDVCGAAVVLDLLGWPRLVSAVPELGQGSVRTAHGLLPVPPPAVLEILRGRPVKLTGPPGEAVTPTGAALLAVLAEVGELPPVRPDRVGYGIGTARWPDRANVLRMTLGEQVPQRRQLVPDPVPGHPATSDGDRVLWILECNLDDCPGQLVARAIEVALENGALDAWAGPLTMKKGRPGLLLGALVPGDRRQAVIQTFLSETTTLGVRSHPVERVELAREWVTVETAYGVVRVKIASDGQRILGAHPEYADCLARATESGMPVKEVMAAALATFRARPG